MFSASSIVKFSVISSSVEREREWIVVADLLERMLCDDVDLITVDELPVPIGALDGADSPTSTTLFR